MTHPKETYDQMQYGDTTVFYTYDLDGGGQLSWAQAVVSLVQERLGPVDRALEWCAGPGFIGFSLLSQGLCRSLTLADVNPRAVEAAQATIDHNDLAGTVDVYLSDCFDAIPSEEKWDLVVGNPPHFGSAAILPVERSLAKPEIIYQDAGWRTHRKFYDQVGGHLNDGASIVLVENANYSGPELFRPMIEASPHLTWVQAIDAPPMFFLAWSRRKSADS